MVIDTSAIVAILRNEPEGPGFIRLTKGDCVSVARPAISTERFVRNFSNVWTAHHHRHTCQTNRISHPVGFLSHSGHCADPHQFNLLIPHKLNNLIITHWPGISID